MTQHRIEFVQNVHLIAQHFDRDSHDLRELDDLAVMLRQEFVQWRVERPNGYR